MKLEIKEDVVALVNQLLDQCGPAAGKQFLADLEAALPGRNAAREFERLLAIGEVQRDDDAGIVGARISGHIFTGFIDAQLRQLGQSHCMAWLS